MEKISFILGGARSGKSTQALILAKKCKGKRIAFIATALALDKEMAERIEKHKKTRPRNWQTFEEVEDVALLLHNIGDKFDCIIIDCLTLLVSNLMLKKHSQIVIETNICRMLAELKKVKAKTIIVANEVGLGIVPLNKLARKFRDIAGTVNQITAKAADEVFFMAAGLPLKIK